MPSAIVETPPKKYKVVFVRRIGDSLFAKNDFDAANKAESFRRQFYPDFEVEEFYLEEEPCQTL